MPMLKFTKMQGTGNDYIIIDGRKNKIGNYKKIARGMCDRHFGVGSDGVLILLDSNIADSRMRIFNPDGSEAEMCGNGIRCFAKYLYEHEIIREKQISIETAAGLKKMDLLLKTGMVIDEILQLADGSRFTITSVSMGNPHVVIFVEEIEKFPIDKYGLLVENHTLFPKRTNVEFVKVISKNEVIQRTWERGTGETLSCGTGASAVTAACILNKLTGRKILIRLKGGDLKTEWREEDNNIYLSGPAVEVFRGEWGD
jgi:diaminopimelate epimerase